MSRTWRSDSGDGAPGAGGFCADGKRECRLSELLVESILKGHILGVPRKIRDLIKELEKEGFVNKGGKGSHRVFKKKGFPSVTISGKAGSDALAYQEKIVKKALSNERN